MNARTSDDRSESFESTPVSGSVTGGRPRKRAEIVREKLVELIRDGHLKEGEKLPTEPQLAAMFGVGRSSVREAVQSLIGLGLVEMRPGLGAYLRRLSINDVVQMVDGAVQLEYGSALQLHEVRAMIEITAARLASVRRTAGDLTRMQDAILHYRIADHSDNVSSLVDADLEFHRAIVEATHNDLLVTLLDSISGLLREHRRQFGSAHELRNRPSVIEDHERILATIARHAPDDARRAMQSHMRTVWQQIEWLASKEDGSSFAGESYSPMYEDAGLSPWIRPAGDSGLD
jgi:GntR family transcriptional repressor for pyruvate dehydrogenase complex